MHQFFVQIASIKKSTLLACAVTGVTVMFCLYNFMERFENKSSVDYMSANILYSKWEKSREDQFFTKLQQVLERRTDLHAKFDPLIAQKLLGSGKGKEAAPYAENVFKRSKDASPFHRQFSETSLTIGRGEFTKALEASKSLKEQMKNELPNFLQIYNLVRIAVLEKEIGTPEGERLAWEEVLKNPAFPLIQQNFRQGNLSLSDFISTRMGSLTPQ